MDDYTFLPDYAEINNKLHYIFKDGRIVPVEDTECEILKTVEFYNTSGFDDHYLKYAYHDNMNPFIERKCDKCGNALMRHVVLRKTNIYVCICGKYIIGDQLSQ